MQMTSALLGNLLVFGRLLRALGLEVHLGRLLDVAEALQHVNIGAREDVYHTCRALLVHRHEDLAIFDRAFDAFWRVHGDGLQLPSRRADLYWEAVQVLLNWRAEVDAPIDDQEAVPQLEYLAFEMCRRGVQRLREDEVLELWEQMRGEFKTLRRIVNGDWRRNKVRSFDEKRRVAEPYRQAFGEEVTKKRGRPTREAPRSSRRRGSTPRWRSSSSRLRAVRPLRPRRRRTRPYSRCASSSVRGWTSGRGSA